MRSASVPPWWRVWAPPILWAFALLTFSGEAGSSQFTVNVLKWVLSWIMTPSTNVLNWLHSLLRKAIHVFGYGILSVLWFRALTLRFPGRSGANVIFALVLSLAVALVDEGHQALVPSRQGRLGDVALDMAGAVLLTTIAVYYKRTSLSPPEARPPSP